MVPLISLLVILSLSILITRIATIALIHTGLAPQSAKFQARSAFTGVGFTTDEAEKVVNHPVRRRILMLLMLLGNAGIVSAVASIMLTFVDTSETNSLLKFGLLVGGIALLWTAAQSQWLDQRLSTVITKLLKRWTDLDVRDYASLLHVGGEYRIAELRVEDGMWMAGESLRDLKLREEGAVVLGIQYSDGTYMGIPDPETILKPGDIALIYARSKTLEQLDQRRKGIGGTLAHHDAVAEQHQEAEKEREKEGGTGSGRKLNCVYWRSSDQYSGRYSVIASATRRP